MDDLVLNLVEDVVSPTNIKAKKLGGRWTERLKLKRGLKRKTRQITQPNSTSNEVEERPAKRPRQETHTLPSSRSNLPSAPPRPAQVISSLFTYNPKVDLPNPKPSNQKAVAPSNAPLDSSSFSGLGLDPLLVSHLTNKMGIQKPTAIQRAVLPNIIPALPDRIARDIFIQSQTGSGKTLAYLLPIIQDLLPLSSLSYIDRSIGTLAVIIAPTRELAKQISDVLEALLKMRLRPDAEEGTEPDTSVQLTRWLVSGLLVGGATRTHEKARLRKGVPILVSTPGRLLDHLQNTSSFNVGKCRWLVLDEADQLMELGFEETIKGIVQGLDGRRRLAKQAMEEGKSVDVGDWDWELRRRTILCSATIREDVQKLAGNTLIEPRMIKATQVDKEDIQLNLSPSMKLSQSEPNAEKFTPPSQLSQKYVIVPLKLRLVTLVALLRNLISAGSGTDGTKIMIFLSCTDSVDFHWNLLAKAAMAHNHPTDNEGESGGDSDNEGETTKSLENEKSIEASCSLLPGTMIYRLHGSLPTATRLAVVKSFSRQPKPKNDAVASSVLFCTSVASRGLDLPLVRAVIQYDLPTEGGVNEYVHRVGRTARAGKGGEAWSFVLPSEKDWVPWIETKMQGETKEGEKIVPSLGGVSVDNILKSGFGTKGPEFEERATEVQLTFERWVLAKKENAGLAQQAYQSHIRAYATHPTVEKHIFHVRNLHLGHLAKAFALRDAPTSVKGGKFSKTPASSKSTKTRNGHREGQDWTQGRDNQAEKRMQAIVRAQGRLTKKGGIMTSTGASEFQLSGGYDLEKVLDR